MFKERKIWLVLALFITLFLAGCRCDNSVIPTYFGIGDTPANGEVTSLNTSFNWHGSDTCDPDEYIFRIEEGGISSLGLVNTNIGPEALPYTYVGGVGSDLEPGKSYTWYLTAINGSNNGDPPVFGPKTEVGQFFTGPICSGETLIAPDLLDPESAGWVEHGYKFKWNYTGGCLPTSYEVQFAWDAAFTNIYLTASTSDPYAQELLMAFPDCSSLFWRVRANDGTSMGPWSDVRDFHYIISGGCYQWHYMSDDYAWINVRLHKDHCDQTGFVAAWTPAPLHTGCMVDGMIIVGDATSYSYSLSDFTVDLGAGPCPSTGLDQKNGGYQVIFGVLTPGTYCVTLSKDQTINEYGSPISMMGGIWTNPRTNQIVAEQTIDFGPGNSDHVARFVWDETERTFLTFPLEKVKKCYLGPEPHCPVVEFTEAGAAVPILGRDKITEWLLSEVKGKPCYLRLEPVLLEKYENENGIRLADLKIFPQPDPCPKPETEPETKPDPGHKTCSDYKTKNDCDAHAADGCTWAFFGSGGVCFGP